MTGASITTVTGGSGATYTVTVRHRHRQRHARPRTWSTTTRSSTRVGNKLGGTGAGNGNFTGQVYTIDKTAPTVQSINRAEQRSRRTQRACSWTVTFSESVTGVNAADFALVQAAASPAPRSRPSAGSGTTYTVTATTGTGSGTLGLNLVDDDTIVDGVANPLGGTGAGNGNFTGQVYTIDKTRAVRCTSINRVGANPTNARACSGPSPSARPSPA